MSNMGAFAARYEHLQRGMLDLAELRLHEARLAQQTVEEKLMHCVLQRESLRQALSMAHEGWRIRELSEQMGVAAIVESRAREAVEEAVTFAEHRLLEVRRLHQDAERWATVVEHEADRKRTEQRRLETAAADEWAVQAYGRPAL